MKRLKERRIAAGLTQIELAKLAGTTHSNISLIESGKRYPCVLIAKAIADALGCKVDDLL